MSLIGADFLAFRNTGNRASGNLDFILVCLYQYASRTQFGKPTHNSKTYLVAQV